MGSNHAHQNAVSLKAFANRIFADAKVGSDFFPRQTQCPHGDGLFNRISVIVRTRPFSRFARFRPIFTHTLKHLSSSLQGRSEHSPNLFERPSFAAHPHGSNRINFIIENGATARMQFVGNSMVVVFFGSYPLKIFVPVITWVSIFVVYLVTAMWTLAEGASNQSVNRDAPFCGPMERNHKTMVSPPHISRMEGLKRLKNSNSANSTVAANFVPMVGRHLLVRLTPFFNVFRHKVSISYQEV